MTAWASMKLLERILDRLEQRQSAYRQFNHARDEICEYFRPDLGIETDENNQGKFFGEGIYEGTGPWAARVMATGFQGNLVSKSIDWLSYLMSDTRLRGIDPLDAWLQDVKEHMTDVYQHSTFYDEQPQFTLDALTIGSPVMFGEEDTATGSIIWQPSHYKHTFLFYDKRNRPYGCIIVDPNWTSKQIFDEFIPRGNRRGKTEHDRRKDMLSIALNNELDQGQHKSEHTVIRAVFKADDEIWDTKGFTKPFGDHKWISVYFEKETDKDKDTPLETSVYFSQPFVVWDYDKKRHEALSRTPAYEAMFDNYSNQTVFQSFLDNVQLKNKPPMMAIEEMRGRVDYGPAGEMYVSPQEYKTPPVRIDVAGDIALNRELNEILMEKLKRHFHLDLFNLFTQVAHQKNQPLTATQIWQMAGEKSTLLSPAVESHSRYLKAVDDRMIEIETRARRGPFSFDRMAEVMDAVFSNSDMPVRPGITPQFVGPLARAQRIQQAVEPIISGLQTMAPVFELFPESKHIIRTYELADKLAEVTNFPMDCVNTKEEYMEIVAAIRQKAASDEQFMKAIEMAKASGNLQGPVDENSVLANMAGALTGG